MRHLYRPPRNRRLPPEYYNTIGSVCFLTIRAYRHQSPFIRPAFNDAVIETLRTERQRLKCLVHVYCLMPDHLHLLVSPQADNHSVLTFVDRFKGKTTNLSWRHGWRGKLWQPRSYDDVVHHEDCLPNIGNYILGNPARRDLVQPGEEYPWCGIWDGIP